MFRLSILLLLLFAASAASQTFYGTTDLRLFREGRDKEFRNHEESPLRESDFGKFVGLKYFATGSKYRVSAIFSRMPSEKYFLMPTSNGKPKKFRKVGELRFRILGTAQKLAVYQIDAEILKNVPELSDLLFVPFKDLTNGKETYGVGRYIDIKDPKGDRTVLDFNLAYNPNCAYGSDKYACPLPPRENHLRIAIRAGEKTFKRISTDQN